MNTILCLTLPLVNQLLVPLKWCTETSRWRHPLKANLHFHLRLKWEQDFVFFVLVGVALLWIFSLAAWTRGVVGSKWVGNGLWVAESLAFGILLWLCHTKSCVDRVSSLTHIPCFSTTLHREKYLYRRSTSKEVNFVLWILIDVKIMPIWLRSQLNLKN